VQLVPSGSLLIFNARMETGEHAKRLCFILAAALTNQNHLFITRIAICVPLLNAEALIS